MTTKASPLLSCLVFVSFPPAFSCAPSLHVAHTGWGPGLVSPWRWAERRHPAAHVGSHTAPRSLVWTWWEEARVPSEGVPLGTLLGSGRRWSPLIQISLLGSNNLPVRA